MITDSTSRRYQKRLQIPEIKINTLKGELSSGTINEVKNGKLKVSPRIEIILKAALNNLYVELASFSKKEIIEDNEYFIAFLDISTHRSINFKRIYNSIMVEKPHASILRWSYWNSNFSKAKKLQMT